MGCQSGDIFIGKQSASRYARKTLKVVCRQTQMKFTMSSTSNGPADNYEEQRNDEQEEVDETEEYDEQEYSKLNAEMDAINQALDAIEQQNDAISGELRRILQENQQIRSQQEAAE